MERNRCLLRRAGEEGESSEGRAFQRRLSTAWEAMGKTGTRVDIMGDTTDPQGGTF